MKDIDKNMIKKDASPQRRACELLAPAGDEASFYAAVGNGADAVYLGLEGFNARMKADNFKDDALETCIKYAHFFGVKVYITLNTLVKDGEFGELLTLVKKAVTAHADAFIVQDLGVAAVLRQCFPNIVLHASTQAGIHNAEGAKACEKLGFSRVVLSRETKIADIKAIKAASKIELEFFVHGALCVCFSGNCYLSATEFHASGNRGQCRQMCRMEYSAYAANKDNEKLLGKGFLLSARDLCLIDSLQELALAGVCSFKIEGRMRRGGYVGETVKIYRKAIDEICVKNVVKPVLSSPRNAYSARYAHDISALRVAYSRGEYLNRAYLDARTPSVVNKTSSNHIGIEIGEVRAVKPFKNLSEITIYSTRKINNGDGIKFMDNGVEKDSLGAANVIDGGKNLYKIISTAKVKVGYKAHLIMDGAAEKADLEAKRALPISIEVVAKMYHPVHLSATAETVCGSVTRDVWGDNAEAATSLPMSENQLAEQLSKTGDSGFRVDKIDVSTDNVFIAKSVLNALRRQLLDDLKAAVIDASELENKTSVNNAEIAKYAVKVAKCDATNAELVKTDNLKLRFVTEAAVYKSMVIEQGEVVVLCPNAYGEKTVAAMLQALEIDDKDKLALELPVIANGRDKEVLDRLLAKFKEKIGYLVCENLYALSYAKLGFKLIAGFGMNVANGHTADLLAGVGMNIANGQTAASLAPLPAVVAVVKSSETDALNSSATQAIAGDYFPLMTLAHCPMKTLGNGNCDKCAYRDGMTLKRDKQTYAIRKVVVADCYFQLSKVVE